MLDRKLISYTSRQLRYMKEITKPMVWS